MKDRFVRWFSLPIYPISIILVLGLSVVKYSTVSPYSLSVFGLVSLFLILFGSFLAIWGVLRNLLGSWTSSSLVSAFVFLIVCAVFKEAWLLVLYFLVGGLVSLIFRQLSCKPRIIGSLNLGSSVLLIVLIVSVVLGSSPIRTVYSSVQDIPEMEQSDLPDIYLIILDEYPGCTEVERQFGYNNSGFVTDLESRGLIVEENYFTSFPKTELSLTTILSMDYQNTFPDGLYRFYGDTVLDILEDLGYSKVLVSSGWGGTRHSLSFDYTLRRPGSLLEIFESSAFYRETSCWWTSEFWYSVTLDQFRYLSDIQIMSGSTFTFAHMLGTHAPFVMDSRGHRPNGSSNRSELFLGQLEYTNGRILDFLDSGVNLESSIVIITSDHGPFTEEFPGSSKVMGTDFSSGNYSDFIKSRLSGFLAINLPGNLEIKSEDLIQVNLFRTIFREYFDMNFPNLDNRHYFVSIWGDKLAPFIDVTSLLEDN